MERNNLLGNVALGGLVGIYLAYELMQQRGLFRRSAPPTPTNNYLILGGVCTLLGLGAGFLLAPKAGSKLREDIADMLHNVQEKGYDFAENIQEQGKEIFDNVAEKTSRLVGKAKHAAHFAETNGSTLPDQIENAIQLATVGLKLWNTLANRR